MTDEKNAKHEGLSLNPTARTVVSVFDRMQDADAAYTELQSAGFSHESLSLVRRQEGIRPEFGVEETQTKKTTETGVSAGVVIGGIAGLVALAIPGIGPLLAVGPIAFALTGAVAGGALGGLLGSFAGLGIPTDHAKAYEDAVRAGGVFVAVKAADQNAAQHATDILAKHGARQLADFTAAI